MKKIIYGIIILIIIVGTGFLMIKLNTKEENEVEEDTCNPITGGSFNVIFNTNNDIMLDSMNVCIACSPDTYLDLPIPSKEGYTFEGWYYDVELTSKVTELNTLYITPSPIYEKENCITGYKDITLHAKWNIIDKK